MIAVSRARSHECVDQGPAQHVVRAGDACRTADAARCTRVPASPWIATRVEELHDDGAACLTVTTCTFLRRSKGLFSASCPFYYR